MRDAMKAGPWLGMILGAVLWAEAVGAQGDPLLKFDPAAPPPPRPEETLYDVLNTPPTSPRGIAAAGLTAEQMAELARGAQGSAGGGGADPEEAAYWLRRLTVLPLEERANHAHWALETLANTWLPSDPAARDPETMTRLRLIWELLALTGDSRAMCNLGFMYEGGIGLPKDSALARTWLERASAAGCAEAGPALAKLR